MKFRVGLIALGILSVSTGLAASECFNRAKILGKRTGLYVGYGKSYGPEAAVAAAKADLAGQIRSKVAVTTTDSYNSGKRDASYEATSEASENLVDIVIEERCQTESSGDFEAVVSLSKRKFLAAEREQIENVVAQAKRMLTGLASTSDKMKQFQITKDAEPINREFPRWEERLQTCTALKGCSRLKLTALERLRDQTQKIGASFVFGYKAENALAGKAQGKVIDLLQKEGFKVSPNKRDGQVGRVEASCREKVFPKSNYFTYRIVEVICRATGMIGSKQVFSQEYTGKGMDDSLTAAKEIAREKLH